MTINRNSFEVNGAFSGTETSCSIYGTVEVTLGRETRRVPACLYTSTISPHLNNEITAYGITGRYVTGTKAWPARATLRDGSPHASIHFGFESRSGKHRKSVISFAR